MLSYPLSFLAGLLTSLSPCVLPALPLVVGSAAQRHRFGPLALAGGMIVSFTLVGVTLSSAGHLLGLNGSALRIVAALFLLAAGLTMLSTRLQGVSARVLGPLASRASQLGASRRLSGPWGQFAMGALLGAVWSPCTGPTLGAAVGLATQAGGTLPAANIMLVFGIGASIPLLAVAYLARGAFLSRGGAAWLGARGKALFGVILVGVGVAILFGVDKIVETALLSALPDWWVDMITRY